MTPVGPRISISLAEIANARKEIIEALTPGRRRKSRSCSGIIGMFDVEDTHLRVTGASHKGAVVGVRHELDREYVCYVACVDGGV